MAPTPEAHHHRSSSKINHKPFKSRHATKGFIKELAKGKINRHEKGSRKTPHQQIMSKLDRKNQAKQVRQIKHQHNVKTTSVFAGQNGAPRIVAVVPLCDDCDTSRAIRSLNQSVGIDEPPGEGPFRVRVDRFAQNLLYVSVERDVIAAMNACRLADFVLLLLSAEQEADEKGEHLIRAIEGQGVSNVLTMVQGLDSIQPAKRQPPAVASLKSYINHFFPNQDKVSSLDSDRECANIMRSLCTTTPKGVVWREDRSWMLVEKTDWHQSPVTLSDRREIVLTGVIRGRDLKANRLLQVGDWGHFQIDKIVDATLPTARKRKADEMSMEGESGAIKSTLETPDGDQDDVEELAPFSETMDDDQDVQASEVSAESKGVLLDDHHYFSDDEVNQMPPPPKKLPKGTSSYQAAWFLGDASDSYSDDDQEPVDEEGDLAMDEAFLPQDGPTATILPEPTEAAPLEYPAETEAFADTPLADEELGEYRSSRKTSAGEDLEFPDEIELHPNVLARERLARYRGLRSLKTSTWDTSYDKPHEPENYDRLLRIPDYRAARKSVVNDALVGGIPPGTRVSVHLRNVPSHFQHQDRGRPLTAVALLKHEQKRTVVHATISLPNSSPSPLPSKCELLVQIGSRRFVVNPQFSQSGNTPNDVHKYLRFLHPGQTAVASFIAPVTWGSVPVLYFSLSSGSPVFTAAGTILPPSPSRVLTKRIILTGHPYKIHKKLVTVRYMFFNTQDVDYFKALRLFTKRGRQGFIKESLGTHGYFKAVFDGRISPMDAVGISLYKRVWPRSARAWRSGESGGGELEHKGEIVMENNDI